MLRRRLPLRNKSLIDGQFAVTQQQCRSIAALTEAAAAALLPPMVIRAKLFGPRKPAVDPATPGMRIRIVNPWHAVSIECGRPGCPSAQLVAGQRFLSEQAPKLPLTGCTNPLGCRCVYKHHDDRRSGPRRLLDIETGRSLRTSTAYLGEERRNARGRRTTDG